MSELVFAVIFDNDGVLVDSEGYSLAAYRNAILEQGVELAKEDDQRYCGLTDTDIIRDMETVYGTSLDLERFTERKRELYLELAASGEMRVFAGAKQLLEELRSAGVPYAIASSGSREKIEFNLGRAGIAQLISLIVSGESFKRGKPDPEIFLTTAQHLNAAPQQCAVIEDSINGLKAARAAGCYAIGVTNTFSRSQLAPYADRVIDSLEELSAAAFQQMLCGPAT